MIGAAATVSIIIPVFNKLAFTRQCLDRIARDTSGRTTFEVIVIDNGSTDGTKEFFGDQSGQTFPIRYQRSQTNLGFARANNVGARLSDARYLLFLNNDTLVQPGWLDAMVQVAEDDQRVGIVGIKQLFPYTNLIHHTGIIFTADRKPTHLYPHTNALLPHVNKQREYQAVTGSCLLIARDLFVEAGMFDEGYLNGYEDVDLCLTVRQRGRSVVCCTKSFIYHYGQISDTRTDDDDKNAARFMAKWDPLIKPDELDYFRQDRRDVERAPAIVTGPTVAPSAPPDLLYFADDLSSGSALAWVNTELVLALNAIGAPVAIQQVALPASLGRDKVAKLKKLMLARQPTGGVQIRWSHYWPQHLGLELTGRLNLEPFVINYLFGRPAAQPWDYWLQCLPQNHCHKLPVSNFCRDVLLQIGVAPDECHVLRHGYSPEIAKVDPPSRRGGPFRILTVTSSHDLERYGTKLLLEAYWQAFSSRDDVVLVLKDYGTSSGDTTLRELLRQGRNRAAVEYVTEFTSKEKLIELYKSCDAFVSAHRGEGFSMKILDAMACGLPVVTPLFGGPTDFCNPSNCFPVEFDLAPVGDCLDTRSLRITNSPMWAEPRIDSLVSQLQAVVRDPESARQLGERARRDVVGPFTWDNVARQLRDYVGSIDQADRRTTVAHVRRQSKPAERSPYWLGRRISVIVPTYNRKETLLRCLGALERQSILPQEFEVIVVDDGSTDGTGEMLKGTQWPFELKYVYQANRGPGAARNEGVRHADGEMVLFIGDDIMADTRLLEEHLLAHAPRPQPGAAVLGHIDWPPEMRRSAVMDFVCGESSLQFAYAFIPKLSALDYRFFYTSNISLKRQFLVDAAADDVAFDPCFTYAAFEDSELAVRLEKRGLQIQYCDRALVYHDHWMDLDSFARREYGAGRMAVVFYRKHPGLDEQLQIRWMGDWADAVESLSARHELSDRLRALDAETDVFLGALARSLEELIDLQTALDDNVPGLEMATGALTTMLHGVLTVIFDVERTRGKVDEWYRNVDDPARIDTARRLLGCVRKMEFFSAKPKEIQKLHGTIRWLERDVVGNLRTRLNDLERQLGGSWIRRPGVHRVDRALVRAMRKVDLLVQQQLGRHAEGRWLNQYHAARNRLKRVLRRPTQSSF